MLRPGCRICASRRPPGTGGRGGIARGEAPQVLTAASSRSVGRSRDCHGPEARPQPMAPAGLGVDALPRGASSPTRQGATDCPRSLRIFADYLSETAQVTDTQRLAWPNAAKWSRRRPPLRQASVGGWSSDTSRPASECFGGELRCSNSPDRGTVIEIVGASTGWLLGGTLGPGNVLSAFGMGPLLGLFLPRVAVRLDYDRQAGQHLACELLLRTRRRRESRDGVERHPGISLSCVMRRRRRVPGCVEFLVWRRVRRGCWMRAARWLRLPRGRRR